MVNVSENILWNLPKKLLENDRKTFRELIQNLSSALKDLIKKKSYLEGKLGFILPYYFQVINIKSCQYVDEGKIQGQRF